jgi:hypothetical protein
MLPVNKAFLEPLAEDFRKGVRKPLRRCGNISPLPTALSAARLRHIAGTTWSTSGEGRLFRSFEDEICSHALIDRSNGSWVEKICRTYGKNFYEAVEVCQAAALCEDSAVRKRNLDTLDAEIDAFNNLIAVQCIGS